MSFVGTAIVGAGVLGAGATIFASSQQQKSQQAAIQQQQQSQQQAIQQITQLEQPFVDYSKSLQPTLGAENQTLTQLLTPGANQTAQLSQLPGFQFTEDLAKWGIQAGAGNKGFSGSTALAGGEAAAGIASQYWNNLISQLQGQYQQNVGLYGTGASVAGGAGGQVSGVTTGTGGNISQLLAAQGQTQAGGITGAAGGVGNALTLSALIGGLKNQNAGAGPNPTNLTPYIPNPVFNSGDPASGAY